jgi:hypothetical protein
LQKNHHPLLETVEKEYLALQTRLHDESAIFPSFFKLIYHLQERQQHYHLILRTFGKDLQAVVDRIETTLPTERFSAHGRFQQKILQIGNQRTLEKVADIYNFFKSNGHLAIQYNWQEWNSSKRQAICGKYFPYHSGDESTLSLFFDDNVKGIADSPLDIIHAVDVANNRSVSVHELVQKHMIFKVDTLRAILEDDYYIELLNRALSKEDVSDAGDKKKD